MKKTISLFLALVMLLSLCAVPVSAANGDLTSGAEITRNGASISPSNLNSLSAGDEVTITMWLSMEGAGATMTLRGLEFDMSTYGMTYVQGSAQTFEGGQISAWRRSELDDNGLLTFFQIVPSGSSFTVSNPARVSARYTIDNPATAEYRKVTPIVYLVGGQGEVLKTEYTVTYNANGGDRVPAQTVPPGTVITLPAATRNGYSFNGWLINGQVYNVGASYTVNSDVMPIARWVENPPDAVQYTVTFNANGGTGTMSAQTFAAETAQNLRANAFTRSGYTFSGWNTAANGSGTSYANGASYTATGNVTLYAQWTRNAATYTVTFNANGGAGTMSAQTFTAGTAQNLTANAFTRTGYTFNGWNTAANGSGTSYANSASYTATGNVTLYAQWTQNAAATYTVTFNANGGTGTMTAQTFTAGTAQNLTANAFTRTGYTFSGWNTAANGSGTSYANAASYTATGNVTLYAQWTANASGGGSGGSSGGGGGGGGGGSSVSTYAVTFNANGGTGTMSPQTFTGGTGQNLTANAFTRTGYTFSGWSTAANGSGTSYSDGERITPTRNLTLYAQWIQNEAVTHTVTFDANGGTGEMSPQTFTEGTARSLNANAFTRTGYTFTGWNTAANGSGTSYADGASYTATADVTLYAQWEQNPVTPAEYVVTLNLNGGAFNPAGQSDALTVSAGESVTLPAASQVILLNRILTAWNTAANGSGTSYQPGADFTPMASVTLYAQWEDCPHEHTQPSSTVSFAFVEGSDPHQHEVITAYGESICADCGATVGGTESRNPENCTPIPGWRANSTMHWHNCAQCGHEMDVENHIFDANGVCTVCGYARPTSGGGSSGGGGGGSSGGGGGSSGGGSRTPSNSEPIASDGTTTTIIDDDVPLSELPRSVLVTLKGPSDNHTVSGTFDPNGNIVITIRDKDGNPVTGIPGGVYVTASGITGGGEVVVALDEQGNEIDLIEKSLVEGTTAYFLLEGTDSHILKGGDAQFKIKYNAKPFEDVTETMTSYASVRFTSSHELFQGYSETQFRPAVAMNRSMLVAVLWRLENKPDSTLENTFPDVVDTAYFTDAMRWATQNNITQGYSDGTFRPYNPITRQAMAALMYRYMQYTGLDVPQKGDLSKFPDHDKVGAFAKESLEWAVGAGIINGKADGTLDPLGNATRAQVAMMLQRMVTVMVKQ